MDIERVNENTIKLFMTYRDIEDRGYSREEIWYNRAKGEELFWDMIGEVNTEDYFDLDGPIWIHINASEHGLEVVVTRANLSAEGDTNSLIASFDEHREAAQNNKNLDEAFFDSFEDEEINNQLKNQVSIFKFKDIDELIPLAKRLTSYGLVSSLFNFENYFYLSVDLNEIEDVTARQNIKAIICEYFAPSKLTIYRLQEYGETIMNGNCFETVVKYFS